MRFISQKMKSTKTGAQGSFVPGGRGQAHQNYM